MTVTTLYYNDKNKYQLETEIKRCEPDKLYRIRIDEYDEKTRIQEEKYHAMLTDISKQMLHLTQKLDVDSWKRLCVAQFKADSIENNIPRLAEYWRSKKMQLVPSLDGRTLVTLGDQTRDFPKYVASGFIEWLVYFGSTNHVKFRASKN